MATFLDHPAQWRLLADSPELAGQAVDTCMRVRPVVPIISRVAVENLEYRGVQIPAGAFVSLFTATAHTDPRVFGSGGFDITIVAPAPQPSFGSGPHYCLGAPLSRAEMAETLPVLARRMRFPRQPDRSPGAP